jgi:hypothetical protein
VTGALALLAGAALLATGSLRLAARLAPAGTAPLLLGAYVIAWAQLVLVLWALSFFGWVERWPLLLGLAATTVALVVDTRGRRELGPRLHDGWCALREGLAEPVALVLGLAVSLGFGYAVVLGLTTPQNDFDTIFDHLWRAALWRENGAAGYPDCACAPYVNAYPPHGELGVLATMTLGGADRYVALIQAGAYVALALAVVGVARGLGLTRGEALLGGLLVATLPVIALQSSTAQNDLVVASFVVAAAVFLLQDGRAAPWLAGAAAALAVGTKLTALVGVPLLVAIALVAPLAHRRAARLTGVLVGSAVGGYWYVVNWRQAGSWDAGFPDEEIDRGLEDTAARALRSAIQFVELPGGAGRDRWLYAVSAVVVLVVAGVAVLRGGRRRIVLGLAALVALAPVLVPDLRRYLDEAYLELWRALGRDDLAAGVGRDITRSASNVTWYGPLGLLLVVGGIVVALVAVRRRRLPWVAVLLALAPVYWLVALSALLFYQDAAGRFFMAPVALAGATWGLAARVRWAAWGLAAIGVTTLALAVLNDSKRPSGVPLLERPAPTSYLSEPRWSAQGREVFVPELIRFVDERVPTDARVGVAITPSDPGYVLLGPALDRRLVSLGTGALDTPGATWAFVSPSARGSTRHCAAWQRLPVRPSSWDVYRRPAGRC